MGRGLGWLGMRNAYLLISINRLIFLVGSSSSESNAES